MFRFHHTNLFTAFPRSLGLILELRPLSCSHKVALVQDYRGGSLITPKWPSEPLLQFGLSTVALRSFPNFTFRFQMYLFVLILLASLLRACSRNMSIYSLVFRSYWHLSSAQHWSISHKICLRASRCDNIRDIPDVNRSVLQTVWQRSVKLGHECSSVV